MKSHQEKEHGVANQYGKWLEAMRGADRGSASRLVVVDLRTRRNLPDYDSWPTPSEH